VGERSLVISGLLLQAAGMGWLAVASTPESRYIELLAPMILGGVGFALAFPAVTKAVVSLVPPPDIGKASGAFSTLRQLGGAFGVAILGAVFTAGGDYTSASAFSDGYRLAMGAAAALALAGAAAATAVPARNQEHSRRGGAQLPPPVDAQGVVADRSPG
jgi:MFS family permease